MALARDSRIFGMGTFRDTSGAFGMLPSTTPPRGGAKIAAAPVEVYAAKSHADRVRQARERPTSPTLPGLNQT